MMNFSAVKMVLTALAALLILGPNRLPSAWRAVSKTLANLRKASGALSQELSASFSEEPAPARRPLAAAPSPADPADPAQGPPDALPEDLRPGPR